MNKRFTAELDQLYQMLEHILAHAKKAGFDRKILTKIELALEEALVNIINYGYPNKVGSIDLKCEVLSDQPGLKIDIKDWGVPFNPIAEAAKYNPDLSKSKEIVVGGCGIFFIVNMMDQASYRRDKDSNILTLVKYV